MNSPEWPGKFSFVSIHNDWKTETIRVTQIVALQKALKERSHPVILAGDFNAVPQSDSLKLLTKENLPGHSGEFTTTSRATLGSAPSGN